MTVGAKILPVIEICGKGHDQEELDKLKGNIFVIGPCAIEELKGYFENRPDRKNLNIIYFNYHFDIPKFARPFMKATGLSLKQLSVMMDISFPKLISGFIGAKCHKANFIGVI